MQDYLENEDNAVSKISEEDLSATNSHQNNCRSGHQWGKTQTKGGQTSQYDN